MLAEVATFVTPNTFERGRYCLKKQFWADFDPGFPYFNPQSRQAAVNRGLELKLWKPHQQLRGLAQGLPPGMEGLQAFTNTHFGNRSGRFCLQLVSLGAWQCVFFYRPDLSNVNKLLPTLVLS